MKLRRLPLAFAAFAVAGLAAAPAAAAGGAAGGFVEICTAHGSAWIKLPGDLDREPARKGDGAAGGCAHMLCPRGDGPQRKKGRSGG